MEASGAARERIRDWAESGVVVLTGRPDGPPVVPPGRAASYARELSGWIAAATADTAHPVRVDGARVLAERAAYTGGVRGGDMSVGRHCRLLPTADGWAAISCARPDDPALLGAMVGRDVGDDPWPAVAAWLRERTGADLGERAELLGIAAAPIRPPASVAADPTSARPRNVQGLLVVDFSALWAGPLCAQLLGAAGARVIKVETPNRLDGARFGDRGFYDLLHAGHESVVLDPGTGAGREAMARLVDAADVVIEASRPRALERFGLDAHAAVDEGTTWISITARGRDSGAVGFGDDVAASSGLVALDGAGAPMFAGDAIADPLTGLTAAVRAMSVPPGGGAGHLWEVAMADVVAATLAGDDAAPPSVYRRDGRWLLDTEAGAIEIASPSRRPGASGHAPGPGRDTARVLRELGLSA
ncbi:CoA transferase [Prescottella defluvii]|uniref:CoA transferase n=1 Tax=Prescottella defluvii TaxID=1323361 RepID=UPI0004F27AB2|nr:CoA transferase [Prescottella defluvii]